MPVVAGIVGACLNQWLAPTGTRISALVLTTNLVTYHCRFGTGVLSHTTAKDKLYAFLKTDKSTISVKAQ